MKIITTDVIYLGKATPGSGGGGGGAVIDTLNVTPSTSAQTITASGGTDGYSPVNVAAVTSAIDANIVAGNIKSGVNILGVTGTYAPTGTISITSNGTHDVTNYATADVQVPTTAPTGPYLEWSVSGGQLVSTTSRIIDLTGVTYLTVPLARAYTNNQNISGVVSFNDIKKVGDVFYERIFDNTYSYCSNITSADLSTIEEIAGAYSFSQTFRGCNGLTSANLSSLKTITANYAMDATFLDCRSLINVDISSLESVNVTSGLSTCFGGCSSLITIRFQSLNNIGRASMTTCFRDCVSFQSLWFYALTPTSFGNRTDQFNNMLSGCSNVTVHFPMAIQSTIGSWTSVTAGFAGTNTTVSFDLVTTLTGADSNTYTRQEKDSTSTATAWVYNNTLYYTSGVSDNTNGVNEPTVGTTIYSDAACTTSVTTVSAIA